VYSVQVNDEKSDRHEGTEVVIFLLIQCLTKDSMMQRTSIPFEHLPLVNEGRDSEAGSRGNARHLLSVYVLLNVWVT
jgi:hypothetical protein